MTGEHDAGKGDCPRKVDGEKFRENYSKIKPSACAYCSFMKTRYDANASEHFCSHESGKIEPLQIHTIPNWCPRQ